MSHREEVEALNILMLESVNVAIELEKHEGMGELAAKLRQAVTNLSEVRTRHEDRNNICASLEAAALEYGANGKPRVLHERAYDLYQYDATIHPPKAT